MVRKTRSDKKDTICKRCGHECSTPQKLREHIKRKNPCKPLQKQKEVASIQAPIQVPIQKATQQSIQTSEIKAQVESSSVNRSNKKKPHVVIPTPISELEFEKEDLVLGDDYITEIKGYKRLEKDLEFREQEELGTAIKRRAIAVHRAKVPKSHPDNGSDIRKMLESQRKQFREILEKEFDKRGQFKFALCSLTKFLIDDKPGKEKQEKKNSRTDWLRNKQIIVYNRAEIDDYLSNAFEEILYQVEERGGKTNA